MRVCIVYDSLFPYTVGGAERWYRNLAERLAAEGHVVTFVTLRQWDRGRAPEIPGVEVRAVGPRLALYTDRVGRRRILPPIVFGLGVFWHLLRRLRGYDVVHTASFPYFSLIAAGALRRWGGYRLVVDWHEVWTMGYWRSYLGPIGGRVGWAVQRLCVRIPHQANALSRLHAGRLREEGYRGQVTLLKGAHMSGLAAVTPLPAETLVVFAGRHIPEKRVPTLIPAIAEARRALPDLRAAILGDGPDRGKVERLVAEYGLEDDVWVPGFVDEATFDATLRRALCLVLPSVREGYGLVVVEAAARGVPSVVVAAPDNAAVELIVEGENGFVAASTSSADLAAAILRVHATGPAMRASTAAWFDSEHLRRSWDRSLGIVAAIYPTAL